MNEQTISQKVATPSIFWRSIQSWFRWTIVIVGLAIGFSAFVSFWVPAGPIILLFFIAGSGTAALVTKILVIGLFLVSIVIALLVIPWLFFLAVYLGSNLVITLFESESFADFTFKK